MKGDVILLGVAAAAMLAVPGAVMLWTCQSAGAPLSHSSAPVCYPSSQSASPGSASQTGAASSGSSAKPSGSSAAQSSGSEAADTADISTFYLLDSSDGKVLELSAREYICGVLAAEMPATYHTEALKAQAVAAYTISVYEARRQRADPDPALSGADFTADIEQHQGYMTEEQAREKLGADFDYLWDRLGAAADYGVSHLLIYDGEPIMAAYHAISAGRTESSGNVWKADLPYLASADSSWDILATGYKSSMTYTKAEVSSTLAAAGAATQGDFAQWIEVLEHSDAGYVTRIRAGDLVMTGAKFRSLFGLRSSCFTVVWTGQQVTFEVKGYGHGAGLSQNGADYMARQGSSCEEILAHYYPGTTLIG